VCFVICVFAFLLYKCTLACGYNVTTRPSHLRPGPVPGTQLPGPQQRSVPTVVGRKAGAIAILRDGRFDGTRGAIGSTWFSGTPYGRCGNLYFTGFGAG